MPFLRVFGRDRWLLGDFRNFRCVPEAEGSPCRFPGARGAEREYLRRRRPLPTQLLPMASRLFLLLPMALLLSPLVLLRPLVLPTLPVSLLLSLPSCLPIAGASPRSPVRCGECGGGYGVLRSGTAPRRPVAGPDFRTEGGRCRGRFRFARVCFAFGRLPPFRNFRCIGRSESVLRCRVRCAAGAACCGPSCGSGLRVLRRASLRPARKTDGSKAASRAGICGFAAENRAAGQFGGRGVGPAFEVVDRDLRHDGRDGCAYGVFQRFVVGERRRARGQQRADGLDRPQAANPVVRSL